MKITKRKFITSSALGILGFVTFPSLAPRKIVKKEQKIRGHHHVPGTRGYSLGSSPPLWLDYNNGPSSWIQSPGTTVIINRKYK
jgi:hypothetical protein